MAVTELRWIWHKAASSILLLAAAALPLQADRTADIRAQITYIASALGNGNPSDALAPFDKSYKDYQKLRDYFQALTAGFEVTSEVEILDEQDDETQTKLLVNWTLTLANPRTASDLDSSFIDRRSANLNICLVSQKGKWKIVSFSPIDLFDPQRKPSGKN